MVSILSLNSSPIKELREETGMSQQQFANYFGLPLRTLQGWEQDRRKPPDYLVELLKRIWELEHTRRLK